jgi:hypothetical protein
MHPVQATRLTLDNNLALLGPVFATSWVQPGTLPSLTYLNLMNNAGLAGILPERLPWPNLASLYVLAALVCCWECCWGVAPLGLTRQILAATRSFDGCYASAAHGAGSWKALARRAAFLPAGARKPLPTA